MLLSINVDNKTIIEDTLSLLNLNQLKNKCYFFPILLLLWYWCFVMLKKKKLIYWFLPVIWIHTLGKSLSSLIAMGRKWQLLATLPVYKSEVHPDSWLNRITALWIFFFFFFFYQAVKSIVTVTSEFVMWVCGCMCDEIDIKFFPYICCIQTEQLWPLYFIH